MNLKIFELCKYGNRLFKNQIVWGFVIKFNPFIVYLVLETFKSWSSVIGHNVVGLKHAKKVRPDYYLGNTRSTTKAFIRKWRHHNFISYVYKQKDVQIHKLI